MFLLKKTILSIRYSEEIALFSLVLVTFFNCIMFIAWNYDIYYIIIHGGMQDHTSIDGKNAGHVLTIVLCACHFVVLFVCVCE